MDSHEIIFVQMEKGESKWKNILRIQDLGDGNFCGHCGAKMESEE